MAKIEFAVEKITPSAAKSLLNENQTNRPISLGRIQHYANDMKAGNWKVNGEAIVFADTGRLLNGQHRLRAVMMADVPVEMTVVRGVPEDTFSTFDTGRGRSAADVLYIEGVTTTPAMAMTMASAAAFALSYKSGTPSRSQGSLKNKKNAQTFSHAEILAFVKKDKVLRASVEYIHEMARHTHLILSASLLAWIRYETFKIDPIASEKFIHGLINGTDLKPGTAVHVVREDLIREKNLRRKLPWIDVVAGVVRAWNARGKRSEVGKGILFRHDWIEFPRFE
jgi:hypothetical protein